MNARHVVLQGVPAMAKAIGLDERTLRYLIDNGWLKGIVRIGNRYFATLANLLANFRPDGQLELELRELLDRLSYEELAEVLDVWG